MVGIRAVEDFENCGHLRSFFLADKVVAVPIEEAELILKRGRVVDARSKQLNIIAVDIVPVDACEVRHSALSIGGARLSSSVLISKLMMAGSGDMRSASQETSICCSFKELSPPCERKA